MIAKADITFDKGAKNRKVFISKNPFCDTLNDIRLQNVKTGRYMHTHKHFKSLLSTKL